MGGRIVSIDGETLAPEAAKVSVFDRGFLFGDSVFEVLRTYSGGPFALEEHLARLERSAGRVGIRMPVDRVTLRREVLDALSAAGGGESYVRIVITRGSGPLSLDPDTATAPLRVILVESVKGPSREAYVRGIEAATVATRRAVDETPAAGAKVGNYLANLLAIREAKSRGAQEALIIDTEGHVVEGASSNVFAVAGGALVTPPESAGILAGITRAHLIAEARRRGFALTERPLDPEELYGADEVFITSSIREVLPVVRVDGRTIGGGVPGPVTRSMHRAFRELVGLGGQPMPWE
jgi:branched-chain amino acid aminotransferase